jgi:hypothetical protein
MASAAELGAADELFELCMLGGAPERRYRRLRPEVERMPWGTLDPRPYPAALVAAARRSWTLAAFQEHRTGAACAATLQALIAARAPVDLIAVATRFPLDEMVHVEMCARLAGELGGGTPILHDARALVPLPDRSLPSLLQAAELVVRVFCVGEAVSIPLLRGTWRAATHPLVRAVMGRIVKDEAAHGRFGWLFLDWAADGLGADERVHLGAVARDEMKKFERNWDNMVPRAEVAADVNALGWMESREYLALARRSLEREVRQPLAARGLLD